MQFALKILSGVCLLLISFSFSWFPLTVILEGEGGFGEALLITMFAVPAIVALVASYRQFFKPQRGLIITLLIFIFLMTIALFLLFHYLETSIGNFNEMTGPEGPNMHQVTMSTREILISTLPLYLAMLIPVFVNFRKPQK